MASLGGQEACQKMLTASLSSERYFTSYPTCDDILDDFDVSMLDWECSGPPVNGGGCSPHMGHSQAVNSSYAGNSYPATASRDCSNYENDSLAGDTIHDSQLWDSDSTYPPQVTTAAESWSAAGPNQSRFLRLSQTAGQRRRKLKLYASPPQSDPELEKRRRCALQALRNRDKGSRRLEEQQHAKLDDAITQDVSRLKEQKSTRQKTVATLQAYFDQLSRSSSSQHTGEA
ncbi:uncharacterized protein [Procambarus clarkii]|uniref:uncharacterized protein n=1 Tax=Procambarus clarkii TaxID=6728 RepID=UPI001E677F30|nr:uncharacterized protein LOC123753049 [Procambarus clarkii]